MYWVAIVPGEFTVASVVPSASWRGTRPPIETISSDPGRVTMFTPPMEIGVAPS